MDKNFKGLSGSTLKIIAIISMFIDHFAAIIIARLISSNINIDKDNLNHIYILMRDIGRIAFPIFCYLIIEGFLHTKNLKNYIFRLFIFAMISEPIFDLAFNKKLVYIGYQNVFFTLLLGVLAMTCIRYFEKKENLKSISLYKVLISFTFMFLAFLLNTDYSFIGVAAIIVMYSLRNNKKLQFIVSAIVFLFEPPALFAFLFLWFYNGQRGLKLKYIFYLFYPLHLLFLILITRIIGI